MVPKEHKRYSFINIVVDLRMQDRVQLKHRGISLSFIFSLLTESPKTIYIKMILAYPKKSAVWITKKLKK